VPTVTVGTRQSAAIVMSWVARVTGYASCAAPADRRCFAAVRPSLYEWVPLSAAHRRRVLPPDALLPLSLALLMPNRIASLFHVVIESEQRASFIAGRETTLNGHLLGLRGPRLIPD
jgi:hypothetical protein